MSDWSDKKREELIGDAVRKYESAKDTAINVLVNDINDDPPIITSYRPDRCTMCRLGYFRGGHQHPDGTRG